MYIGELRAMNKEPAIKRKIKDSVFTALFSERKYLEELCKVLKPDVTDEELESLSIVTIQNILVDGLYNDLGFMIGNYILYIIEAQSTWSVNIVIRTAMYYFETLRKYIAENNINIYGKKIKIPKPVFYVIYTGKENHAEDHISLSEEFFDGDSSVMDVKVKVIHSVGGGNILDQYIEFTKISDEQVKLYGRTHKAIVETLRLCIENNVLKDFLRSKETEVIDMMTTLFDEETVLKAAFAEKDRETAEAKEAGRLEGEENSRLLILGHMVKNGGFTIEKALEVSGIPKDEWKKYISQLS